jgi:hypothetical protein
MPNINVRSFTPSGSAAFKSLILAKPHNIVSEIKKLVTDNAITTETGAVLELRTPKNRFDMAKILWEIFGTEGLLYPRRRDFDLWNWISAAYFEILINSDIRLDVKRKIGGADRWILSGDVLRDHRHLVSGPYFAYEANSSDPKKAMCQLATPVTQPGELVERISGKRNLASGPVCHLATLLYYDSEKKSLRTGLTTPPGNPKKFSYYFTQIDRTIDYEGMKVTELVDLLPQNFSKWTKLAKQELSDNKNKG